MTWFRTLAALAITACANVSVAADCGSLAPLEWLLGEWRADGSKTTWQESWTAVGPGTWEGRGIETSKADPAMTSAEDLRLVEMGEGVFYLAKVAHNELPVAFRLVECADGRFAFANPGHDFPKRIEYRRQPDGRLQVQVSDGAGQGFTLDFARADPASLHSAAVLAAEDARFAAMRLAVTAAPLTPVAE